jgi:release factor glutamine methyltransferase
VSDATVSSGHSTVQSVVDEISLILSGARIDDPTSSATDIVAALLEVPRSWPIMNREAPLDVNMASAAKAAAKKLACGAPFAYAVGSASFRHLNLLVDERVLIPRPETEVLVGEILERMEPRASWGTAIDVGTGSGAIALSLASEGRFDRVIATDASLDALTVARNNAERARGVLRSPIEFRHGSLLAPVSGLKVSVIVSNPPYVAFADAGALPSSVRDWEPPLALFSGHDGLSATAGIVRNSVDLLESGGILALEVDERRASLVAELMMQTGAYESVGVRLDLTGRERFVFATRI